MYDTTVGLWLVYCGHIALSPSILEAAYLLNLKYFKINHEFPQSSYSYIIKDIVFFFSVTIGETSAAKDLRTIYERL